VLKLKREATGNISDLRRLGWGNQFLGVRSRIVADMNGSTHFEVAE